MQLDLDALDAFAAVARHRNFRRAATERGVSPSTLSGAVRDLEARLGVRLLNRTTRSVATTEAGAALLARLTPAIAEIGAALDDIRSAQAEPSGPLRINAPAPAAHLALAPLLADFMAAYPAVRVELTVETAFVDIVAERFDAGVRWGEHLAQDMVAVPLGPPQRYVIVASPAALARFGRPEHPRDLVGKPCLRVRFPSGIEPPWEFTRDGETIRMTPAGPLTSNDAAVLMRAALDGAGFLATFDGYVTEHLVAGRLVRVLTAWEDVFPGPFLYYPSRRNPPSALKAFVAFVQAGRRAALPDG